MPSSAGQFQLVPKFILTAAIPCELYKPLGTLIVIPTWEFFLLIQFSGYLICPLILSDQSRNIICSQSNLLDAAMPCQYAQWPFLLEVNTCGIDFLFYSWTSIEEIYKDAHTFGQKSSNLQAVTSSSFAIAWLEATFPDFGNHEMEGGNLLALKARPYVPFDASLALQGPLRKVCRHENIEDSEVWNAECEGRAVSFLYNSISQDSVLLTAWSSGQLRIDALADELQPVWNVGSSPRLRVDSGHIVGVAMICESITQEFVKPDQEMHISNMVDTMWLGHPPPLLRLAVVDLALPANAANGTLISIFADPLVPERIYCLHGSGIDLIVLHFLPFSNQTTGKDEPVKAPSVYPILTTCHSDMCSPSSLNGFVALADSFGHSWIVGVTSQECIVMDMKDWNMTLPLHVDGDMKSMDYTDPSEIGTPDIISKELLIGPKVVLTPQASSALRSLAADSIEGRSTLHHYFKLFHENYVEYGHKVYIELKHHGAYLKRILTNQHERLREANQKLLNVEEKQRSLDDRIHHAVQMYGFLEERLQRFRSLPGANQKPLSRAEREFKSQLEPPEDPSPLEAHVVELPQLHVSCLAEPVEGVVALGTAIDVSPQLSIPYPTGSEGGVPITEVPVEELLEPSAPLPTEDSKGEGAPDVSTEVPPSPTILVVSTEATEVGIALKVTEGPSTPTIRALVEEVNATAFAEEVLTAAPVVAMAPIYNARQLAMNFVRQIVTLISTKLAYPDNWSGLHVERDMLLSSAVWVGIDVGLVGNLLARFSDTMSRLEQTKAEAATVQAAREQRDRLLVLEAEIPRLMRVCDVTTNSAKAAEEDAAVQQEMLCVARRKIANLRELLMAAEAEEQATEARLADAKKLVETTRAIAWGEKDQLVELQREMLDLQENLANLPDYSQDIAQGEAEAGRLRGELSEALRDLM
ncbi:uncharacterized protein LOC131244007 isoform X2 [Magnolia sinica]|uniref:uncharacterized protein LOC131244007 isoform X2 n=1 Tax=Magnolia sinica TaxID=86752 RepID=UPI002658A5C9|nr:uncharacterized protein LOC131244007 isoform X2 [Magnolia sinica]